MGTEYSLSYVIGFLSSFGISLVCSGVGGSVLSGELKKKVRGVGVLLSVLSVCLIVIGALSLGGVCFCIYDGTVPPKDYVECDVVIDEDGYQEHSFTADGVTYIRTYLRPTHGTKKLEAVFSYKTSDPLGAKSWGNYYEIENDAGFSLVTDGEKVFCAEDQLELLSEYMVYADNFDYYYYTDDGKFTRIEGLNNVCIAEIANILSESSWKRIDVPEEIRQVRLCMFYGQVTVEEYTVLYNSTGVWMSTEYDPSKSQTDVKAYYINYNVAKEFMKIK